MVRDVSDAGCSAQIDGVAEVLEGFEDPAALIGTDGRIVAHNRAWRVHGFERADLRRR